MSDVANERHGESFDTAAMLANRQHIEQALCRMVVRSVARIQDTAVEFACK